MMDKSAEIKNDRTGQTRRLFAPVLSLLGRVFPAVLRISHRSAQPRFINSIQHSSSSFLSGYYLVTLATSIAHAISCR